MFTWAHNQEKQCPNPHDYLVTACYVQPFFCLFVFQLVMLVIIDIFKQCDGHERLTWEGCRAEPCGNKLPRHASVVWRAASATHTSYFSEAAPPVGRGGDTQTADLLHQRRRMSDFIWIHPCKLGLITIINSSLEKPHVQGDTVSL